jgi:hypothetical protein
MAIDTIRAQIISAIWQAVAQSSVDLTAVSADQQEKLVSAIADKMMLTMDALLENGVAFAPEEKLNNQTEEGEEQVLWQGRPLLSLVESYTITSERLKIRRGMLSRQIENFELIRLQDIDYKQGLSERLLGIGDIYIRGQDPSNPEIVLRNISQPEEVYEILRKAWLEARKRHGLQFREYM